MQKLSQSSGVAVDIRIVQSKSAARASATSAVGAIQTIRILSTHGWCQTTRAIAVARFIFQPARAVAGAKAKTENRTEIMAADDLTDAEDEARAHVGLENHPHGKLLGRLIRFMRLMVVRLKALEDRVSALEGK